MKPQLLLQTVDPAGFHNGAPEEAASRVAESGMWRRQRIVRIKPVGDMISTRVADTHESLAYPPNNGVARLLARGLEVGEAYSQAVEQVLAHPELSQWEYVLTLEHDNTPPPDGVLRLVERLERNERFAAVGGLYFTKGRGGVPQIWGDPKDPVINFRPQPPDPAGGLVECCGLGMGFTLFRLAMFKDAKLRRPWFVTQKKDGIATQDLYFWMDARKHGHRCAVDCSVRVGHYDVNTDYIW